MTWRGPSLPIRELDPLQGQKRTTEVSSAKSQGLAEAGEPVAGLTLHMVLVGEWATLPHHPENSLSPGRILAVGISGGPSLSLCGETLPLLFPGKPVPFSAFKGFLASAQERSGPRASPTPRVE